MAQQQKVRGQPGPRTDGRSMLPVVGSLGGSKRSRGVWESGVRIVPDMVVGAVLVMLLLVAWRATELARLPPDIAHKTTSEWAAKAALERGGGAIGRVLGVDRRWVEGRIHRLVERVPLAVWEDAVVRARARVKAREERPDGIGQAGQVRLGAVSPDLVQLPWDRSGAGGMPDQRWIDRGRVGWGEIDASEGGAGADDVQTWCGVVSPSKKQRAGAQEVGGRETDRRQGPEAERSTNTVTALAEWLWKVRRPQLTVLQTDPIGLLDLKQVTESLGTALEMFVNAVKHAKKRATPAQAWATALEATAAPAVRAVLEAAWKWDGVGGQPDRGQEGPDYETLFLTYRACYTIAMEPDILAPLAEIPPGHQALGDLAQRVGTRMRLGCRPAMYGPVPAGPRPRSDQLGGAGDRWRLHALTEAVVYAAPHDGRLHTALRQELRGYFDQTCQTLWMVQQWPEAGWMESVTVFPSGGQGGVAPEGETDAGVQVWLWQSGRTVPWCVLAVKGTLPAIGSLSQYTVAPGARVCTRCGETHVARCRSRFLPECFRWTDTARQKMVGGQPLWMRCQAPGCGQQPTSERCGCGRASRPVPEYSSGVVVKSFDVTTVMSRRETWFRRVPHIDAMCRHILHGGAYVPTVVGGIVPQARRNLRSADFDRPLLYRLICKYLISGALEYCHTMAERPDNVLPLGLVAKSDIDEPWRAICDARPTNPQLLPWKNKYHGLRACSPFFTPGAFCFSKDFSSAYHNVPLATPCGRRCLGCKACTMGGAQSGGQCAFARSGLQQPVGHLRPTPRLLGQCWVDLGPVRPTEGLQLHHEGLEEALLAGTQFSRERWERLRVRGVTTQSFVAAGGRFYRPAPTGGAMDWVQRRFVGCTPGTCGKAGCQKQMFGVMIEDDHGCPHWFRFAVTHFGVRTAGNLFHSLIAPLIRKYRRMGVRLILWVDDVLVIVPNMCPTPFTCRGAPECTACQRCKETAAGLDRDFSEDLAELGFETNKKDVGAGQSSKFLGIIFDTRTMTFRIEADAAKLFGERCSDMLRASMVTPRDMARLVGVLNWWACAVWGAKLMSRGMQAMSATCAAKEHWDTAILLTSAAKDELVFWRDNTARVAALGMPILVPKFQQMLHMWERGGELPDGQRPQYRLTSDGGPRWGATLSAWPIRGVVKPPLEGSGEYPAEWVGQGWCEHQAWREAVSSLLAIKTFTPIIRGSVVLHLSDCACVVKALQEGGSATSAQVHRWAVEIWQWCVEHGIILLSGWVPGEEVVRLGADRLSREDGVDVHGYTAGPLMQAAVATVCRRRGYALTVDLFATAANKQCPRFCSRFHDVGTEDVDAFTRPSWRVSRCVCGQEHEEELLVFPPTKLLMPVLARLEQEGCKGCIVVPRQPSLPFWSILQGGLVGEGIDVDGTDLQWPTGVHRRPQGYNTYCVSLFDFSARVPLNIQHACAQVREPRMPRALTTEEQVALAQNVARRQLWCSLAESTARLDLEELEEWMGEEDEETEGQEGDPTSVE